MEKQVKQLETEAVNQIIKQLNQIQLILEESQSFGDWTTREHAMRFLDYKNTSMRELEKSGQLVYSQVGRKKYYLKQGIIDFLKKNIQK